MYRLIFSFRTLSYIVYTLPLFSQFRRSLIENSGAQMSVNHYNYILLVSPNSTTNKVHFIQIRKLFAYNSPKYFGLSAIFRDTIWCASSWNFTSGFSPRFVVLSAICFHNKYFGAHMKAAPYNMMSLYMFLFFLA